MYGRSIKVMLSDKNIFFYPYDTNKIKLYSLRFIHSKNMNIFIFRKFLFKRLKIFRTFSYNSYASIFIFRNQLFDMPYFLIYILSYFLCNRRSIFQSFRQADVVTQALYEDKNVPGITINLIQSHISF